MAEIKNLPQEDKKKIINLDSEIERMYDDECIIITKGNPGINIKFSEMNAAMADAIISKRTQIRSSIWSFMMADKATEEEKK